MGRLSLEWRRCFVVAGSPGGNESRTVAAVVACVAEPMSH